MPASLVYRKTINIPDDILNTSNGRFYYNRTQHILYSVGQTVGIGTAPIYKIQCINGDFSVTNYATNFLFTTPLILYGDSEFNVMYAADSSTSVWSFYICDNNQIIQKIVSLDPIFGSPGTTGAFKAIRNGNFLIIFQNTINSTFQGMAAINLYTGAYYPVKVNFSSTSRILDNVIYNDNLFILLYDNASVSLFLYAFDKNTLKIKDFTNLANVFGGTIDDTYKLRVFYACPLFAYDPVNSAYNVDSLLIFSSSTLAYANIGTVLMPFTDPIFPLGSNTGLIDLSSLIFPNGMYNLEPVASQLVEISNGNYIYITFNNSNTTPPDIYLSSIPSGALNGYTLESKETFPSFYGQIIDFNGTLLSNIGYNSNTLLTKCNVSDIITDNVMSGITYPNQAPIFTSTKASGSLINHSRPISSIGKYKS